MTIVDSHCHLYYDDLFNTLETIMANASKADVRYMLTIAADPSCVLRNIEIANRYDNVFASVGIHPSHSDKYADANELLDYLNHAKVIAIGEVGLDYSQHFPPVRQQIDLFNKMLELSESNPDLPYVIHARDCFPDIFEVMEQYNGLTGVFHCYTSSIENAKKILDIGFYISFSGIVTFKNSSELREVLRYIPTDRLLIETDAPYLAPHPLRGQVNEPSYVRLVAERVAVEKNMKLEELGSTTTSNFFNLFKKAELL